METIPILPVSSMSAEQPRRGAVAAQAAICLTAVLGVMALAVDAGLNMAERRHAQSTADAAATAAASDLFKHWVANHGRDASSTGSATLSALTIASANGYANDGTNSTVSVRVSNAAPVQDPQGVYGGALPDGYAEVIVTLNQRRFFSAILGTGAVPVSARAVARAQWVKGGIGIILLNGLPGYVAAVDGALTLSGSAFITLPGNVIVDDTRTKAIKVSGSAGLVAPEVFVSGGIDDSSSSGIYAPSVGSTTMVHTSYTPQTPDPLNYVTPPDPTSLTLRSSSVHSASDNETLQPGLYIGGIKVQSKTGVTMNPGIYYIKDGEFTVSGGASLTANQVMVYNGPGSDGKTGKITISASTVVMSPPTSGVYEGISLFQYRSSTQPIVLSGGSDMRISGTIYGARAPVKVTGGSSVNTTDTSFGSQFIVDQLELSGSSDFGIRGPGAAGKTTRFIGLVE
jgi:Putative Flp pilus-assembly TadE/G-like